MSTTALRNARQLTRAVVGRRAFHSPFAVLSQVAKSASMTPSNQPRPQSGGLTHAQTYEKQLESWAEPSGFVGQRIHVVSDPDPEYHPYAVPIGAYPVSEPYAH